MTADRLRDVDYLGCAIPIAPLAAPRFAFLLALPPLLTIALAALR